MDLIAAEYGSTDDDNDSDGGMPRAASPSSPPSPLPLDAPPPLEDFDGRGADEHSAAMSERGPVARTLYVFAGAARVRYADGTEEDILVDAAADTAAKVTADLAGAPRRAPRVARRHSPPTRPYTPARVLSRLPCWVLSAECPARAGERAGAAGEVQGCGGRAPTRVDSRRIIRAIPTRAPLNPCLCSVRTAAECV